jgi:hypothetical protein
MLEPQEMTQEEAEAYIRWLREVTDDELPPNTIPVLSMMLGVAEPGRRWSWKQAARELNLTPREAREIETTVLAVSLLLDEGVAHGHVRNPFKKPDENS